MKGLTSTTNTYVQLIKMHAVFVKRFEEIGCKLLSTPEEYKASSQARKPRFRIIAACGHLRENVTYGDFYKRGNYGCVKCNTKASIDKRRLPYEDIVSELSNKRIKLLTTEEEYKNMDKTVCKCKFNVVAVCGHERTGLYYDMLDGPGLCTTCMRKSVAQQSSERIRMSYEEIKERFTAINTTLLTTKEEYDTHKLMVGDSKFKIIADCGHEHETRYGDWKESDFRMCFPCARKAKDNGNLTYEEIQERFKNAGCELLVTKEEFMAKKMTTKSCFKFKANCGHERVFIMENVKLTPGMLCKACTAQNVVIKQTENAKKDGLSMTHEIEYEATCYLQSLLEDNFDLWITHESCRADVCIKPKSIKEDVWLPVQLKSTKESLNGQHKTYRFGGVKDKDYTDMLLLCICVADSKIWNIDPVVAKEKLMVNIVDKENTMYYNTKIDINNISEIMQQLYDSMTPFHKPLSEVNCPQSINSQKELEFINYRESCIKCLTFEKPFRNYLSYDFKVFGKKIQEKIGRVQSIHNVYINIHKANGFNKKMQYAKGDNDFYWINTPDKKYFYVIPEDVLIEKGFVGGDKHKSFTLYPTNDEKKNHWANNYKFEYANVNQTKLITLLQG